MQRRIIAASAIKVQCSRKGVAKGARNKAEKGAKKGCLLAIFSAPISRRAANC